MGQVTTDIVGNSGVVRLDNPDRMNAWTTRMQRDFVEAVNTVSAESTVRSIIVTGAGDRAFCAGQDLKELAEFDRSDVEGWLQNFIDIYDVLLSNPKPVVAALNGVAAGSGYQLALVCDFRIGHPGVRMGQPEVKSGIPSITGQYLTELSLGHARTVDLMLSGRLVDAEEARHAGLLNRVVQPEEVLAEAVRLGEELAAHPAHAFRVTKRRVRDRIWPGLMEAFETARAIDEEAWGSGDAQSSISGFFDRPAR